MVYRSAVVISFLALAGCADAASSDVDANKAAAYVVLGLEEGTAVAPSGELVFHQTSENPLSFVAESKSGKMAVTVAKSASCVHDFTIEAKDGVIKFAFDLTGLTSASIVDTHMGMGGPPKATELAGAKMTCKDGQSRGFCQMFEAKQAFPMRFADKDPSRLPEAAKSFKDTYCNE